MTVLESMTTMTIADAIGGVYACEQGGVSLPPYPRCQERRTTFRHRFNCLLSNGSHSPSHSELPGALGWGPRWTDTSRGARRGAILPSRSTETPEGSTLSYNARHPRASASCRTMERKITDRHAKATTTVGLSSEAH